MKITRVLLLIAVIAALAVWYFTALAQDKDDQRATGKTKSVTGCLAKGDSANEFYLTSDDGKKYELRSDKISLGDHIGHKVTVAGTTVKESKMEDRDEDEKNEASEHEAGNLQVTDLKMISESCK